MIAVVLVHGGWHWGGCWDPVRQLLEQEGITVYTPSLEQYRGSTLRRHVEQVVDLIREEQLDRIVLVGHSYAGLVISGVLARLPQRIHHTVFLDAVIPDAGRVPVAALMPPIGVYALQALNRIQPMWPVVIHAAGFGITDPSAAAWLNSHLRPQPGAPMVEPFPYAPVFEPAQCTFVFCREPIRVTDPTRLLGRIWSRLMPRSPLEIYARRAAAAGWQLHELPIGHNAMVIAPKQVAQIIQAVLPPEGAMADRP